VCGDPSSRREIPHHVVTNCELWERKARVVPHPGRGPAIGE
jgi:hypothetical protein